MSTDRAEPGGDILIVDSDPRFREWARHLLAQARHRVREAGSAQEALAEVSRQPPDLILLDETLPDMSGLELTRRLRQHPLLVTTPILLMTVREDTEGKVGGLEAGVDDFLNKRSQSSELLVRIRPFLGLKRNQEELLLEKKKTDLLYSVSHELTAELDLDTLLSRILELTVTSIGASRGSVILLDEEGAVLRHIYFLQGQGSRASGTVLGRVVREGLAGWVIRNRQGVVLADTHQDSRWIVVRDFHASMRSALAVPLIHQDRVVGVLTLTQEQANRFSPAHLELLNSIASQIAVALVNARLFKVVEQERGQLRAIVGGTADAIVATDRKRRITLLNPAAEHAFGVSFAAVAGLPLEEAIPNDTLVAAFRQAHEEAGPTPPLELVLPDGRIFFFQVSSVAAAPEDEGGWVAVMRDITHLKALDRMKSEFVSAVSHDLRTPLSTIYGYAEVLQKMSAAEGEELAQQIKNSARRMADLVEELLDLGKIESGMELVREPCRLDHIAAEAVHAVRFPAQSREVALEAHLPPLSRPVLGNPIRLRQVLDNLLNNALKYTPAGGSIVVRVREKGDHVTATVQDSGVGIPREAIPRLFEKFYRAPHPDTSQASGTGLGLAIVKAIVEQHGGKVWVDSELGRGSTFAFSLPCCLDDDG